jgi:hypothetical protein
MQMTIKLKTIILFLGIVLVVSLAGNIWLIQKNKLSSLTGSVSSSLIKPVLAEEIYPLFFCPCCGQPLDKKNICCEAAKERIDYIDSLVVQNLSEKKIILAFVKKYGLNSFVDENKGEELREELTKTAPADRPIISINPDSYDFGDVSQKTGKVYTYFDLKNEGKSNLVIDRMDTSCGCTFVAIVFEGKESPFFTMPGHGYENPEWEGITIPPGQAAQLKVMYDPDVHQDFRGFAIREISVYSNDPIDFEKKVQVELNQVD